MSDRKDQVIILFGGASDERRVSVASAQHVCARLPDARPLFESSVEARGGERSGALSWCPREHLLAHDNPFVADYAPPGPAAYASLDDATADPALRDAVFFFAYHGQGGEDGTIARTFEARRIAFTGSGSRASADAFDKEVAKQRAREAGVRVAASREVPKALPAAQDVLASFVAEHGRAVAKPVRGGSSVGLHHLRTGADVGPAARAVAASGALYLVEVFAPGPELTVGVVDGPAGLRALPASEVRVAPGRAFDYEGKYLGRGTIEVTPAEVAPEVARAAQAVALTMHRALGCEGYSRTDVIATAEGPVFLELNTLPGLTRASFLPQQLAAEGTSVESFLQGQLALARARRDRARNGG